MIIRSGESDDKSRPEEIELEPTGNSKTATDRMTKHGKDTDSVTNLVRPTSKKQKLLQSTSKIVIGAMERVFYRWGLIVSTHPIKVILVTILLTGLCSGGFYYFKTEADAEKLWLPSDSTYLSNKRWKKENYKEGTRGHIAFTTHEENVLTPEGMLKLLELHRAVNKVEVEGKVYSDFCFKIPITDLFGKNGKKRRRRQVTDFFDERDLELNPENLVGATTRRTTPAAAGGPGSGFSATAATAPAVLNPQRNFDASASAVSPATTERSLNDIGDVLSGVSKSAKKSPAKKTSPLIPTTTTTPTTAATTLFEEIKDDLYNVSPEPLALSEADKELAEKVVEEEEVPDEEDDYDYEDYGDLFNFGWATEEPKKEDDEDDLPPEVRL